MNRPGAYGQSLADCFHLEAAPAFVSCAPRHAQMAVTHIVCNVENNGLSEPIPREDAFLVALHLRDCPAHDLWIDGKSMKTGALAAGTTSIYDLRRSPVLNIISPFDMLHFYFARGALDAAADGEDTSCLDRLTHNPGLGIDDPVIRGLGSSLLPAFERREQVTTLFVDHVTAATAAYVARMFIRKSSFPDNACLSPAQQMRAKAMLDAHLSGDLTVAQLAQQCGVPVRVLSGAFRKATGLFPYQWLRQRRLEVAQDMLRAGRSLPDIVTACGWSSEAQLIRELGRFCGATPKKGAAGAH
jgi:AraC family transcriptional regulator